MNRPIVECESAETPEGESGELHSGTLPETSSACVLGSLEQQKKHDLEKKSRTPHGYGTLNQPPPVPPLFNNLHPIFEPLSSASEPAYWYYELGPPLYTIYPNSLQGIPYISGLTITKPQEFGATSRPTFFVQIMPKFKVPGEQNMPCPSLRWKPYPFQRPELRWIANIHGWSGQNSPPPAFLRKNVFLQEICITMKHPDSLPAPTVKRGPIIAVEGDNEETTKYVADWLRKYFFERGLFTVFGFRAVAPLPQLPGPWHHLHILVDHWNKHQAPYVAGLVTGAIKDGYSKEVADPSKTRRPALAGWPAERMPIVIMDHAHVYATETCASRAPGFPGLNTTEQWMQFAAQWTGALGPDLTIWVNFAKNHGEEVGSVQYCEMTKSFLFGIEKPAKVNSIGQQSLQDLGFLLEWKLKTEGFGV